MEFYESDIGRFAKRFLEFFDNAGMVIAADLESKAGKRFPQIGNSSEFIEVVLRPSESGTKIVSLSYIVINSGIPLDLRVNRQLDYSKLILKSQGPVIGYSPFASDPFGNLIQSKDLKTSNLSEVRRELDGLAILT